MRKQIILDWDTDNGFIYDAQNTYIGSSLTLRPIHEVEQTSGTAAIDDLVKLRNAGFTTEEIIELRRKDLI